MHASHYSSMLPDLFRHKTTKVRISRPQVVLMDFHGTISERRWEDKVIFPYVRQALNSYLKANWADETVQKCVPALRDESFEQRFRNKLDDAPVISDPVNGEDEIDQNQLAGQLSDFLLWQLSSKKETNETHQIQRLVWRDGLKRRQIRLPIYEEVFACVRDWHEKWQCSVYVISSLDSDTLRLLFENTDRGNLQQYLKGFVSPKKSGDKMNSETYKTFYDRLHLDARVSSPRAAAPPPSGRGAAQPTSPPLSLPLAPSSPSPPPSPPAHQQTLEGFKTLSMGHEGREGAPRPILFLTDSGQEARAANQVNDGTAFECILVSRPGNKRFRTYYLSQFPYVERFDDITFVN